MEKVIKDEVLKKIYSTFSKETNSNFSEEINFNVWKNLTFLHERVTREKIYVCIAEK